jgi:ABC-type multidrug transport system fused ATPase/permease subunit
VIKRLYREYRLQIGFAFLLVIFENVAYIAEPFVFGKAIDGLREAHRVEEEVDSSLSTMQMRQIADSVRLHVLDSLRILDSIKKSGAEESMSDAPASDDISLATHNSIFHFASLIRNKHQRSSDSLDNAVLPPVGTPERAAIDSVKKTLAKRDSIGSRRRRSLLKHPREAARDSIRKELKAEKSPGPGGPAGTQGPPSTRPLAFYVTREIGPFIPPLIPWIILFLLNSSLGAFRRIYDTRIYTRMFANLSSDVVARQLAQGEELSKVAARSSMAWHNIEFFQYNVPEFLEQLIAVGGAVIALGLFDWRLSVVGGILIVLVLLGSRYYMNALLRIQVKLHDWYEEEYNIFSTREPAKIRQYYRDISDLEIKYSARSTWSYSVIRVFLIVMFLTTLYISIDLDRFTIGALYSIVAYVWSFVTATEYIPYLSEKWVELKDASRRITDPIPAEA